MKSLQDKIWPKFFRNNGLPYKIHKQIECKISTKIRFYIQDTLVPKVWINNKNNSSEDFRWQIEDKVKHEIAK